MDEETPIPFKQYFPNLSDGAYFWLVILGSLIIFGVLGYFVGIRVNQLPSASIVPAPTSAFSQQLPQQVTPGPYDDNDADYSNIYGYFITNASQYDQFVIRIDSLPSSATTFIDTDDRSFNQPHIGIQYPYMFSRLNPFLSYVVSASSCYTNKKTFALECAKNIKITKCIGSIQGSTCVIKGNGNEAQSSGEVDFLVPGASGSAKKK